MFKTLAQRQKSKRMAEHFKFHFDQCVIYLRIVVFWYFFQGFSNKT